MVFDILLLKEIYDFLTRRLSTFTDVLTEERYEGLHGKKRSSQARHWKTMSTMAKKPQGDSRTHELEKPWEGVQVSLFPAPISLKHLPGQAVLPSLLPKELDFFRPNMGRKEGYRRSPGGLCVCPSAVTKGSGTHSWSAQTSLQKVTVGPYNQTHHRREQLCLSSWVTVSREWATPWDSCSKLQNEEEKHKTRQRIMESKDP